MLARAVAVTAVVLWCSPLLGAYIVSVRSQNAAEVQLAPGESVDVDIVLQTDEEDRHISCLFRVEFDRPGLRYGGYVWHAPYSTGSLDDLSNPGPGGVALPTGLEPDLLAGPGHPDDVVDIELTNLTDAGTFGEGVLVTLQLSVPQDYPPSTVTVRAAPELFDDGTSLIPTQEGQPLLITVIPEPSTVGLIVVAATGLLAQRKPLRTNQMSRGG